jgi:hypothetical protein
MDAAIEHASRGASVWEWASNVPKGEEPDVVLACAGDMALGVGRAPGLRSSSRRAEGHREAEPPQGQVQEVIEDGVTVGVELPRSRGRVVSTPQPLLPM